MPLMAIASVRRRSFSGPPVRRRLSPDAAGLARRPAAKSHTGRSDLAALGAAPEACVAEPAYPPSQAARAASTPAPGALAWPKRRSVTSSAARQVITLSRRQP